MKLNNDFTSKFLIAVLNTAGIPFPRQMGAKYIAFLKYYHMYSFICLTSCQVFMLTQCETIVSASFTLVFIFNGIFLNMLTLSLHVKKKNILQMYELIFKDFAMSRRGNVIAANQHFRIFFRVYGTMYIFIYIISVASPVLTFPLTDKKLGDVNTLLIPCRFPWLIDTYTKYILTVLLQFSWLGSLSLPVLLNIMFTFYFIIEVRVQFSELYRKICKLSAFRWEGNCKFEQSQYSRLKNVIQHQQKITRFIGNFKDCYSLVFSTNLIYSVANLSMLLFVMSIGERSVGSSLQSFGAFVMSMLYLFMYCSVGQILNDTYNELQTILYSIPWFENSLKFRKSFCFFLCSTHKVLNLRAGYTYVASYELFFNILRMSYSFYNLLSQSVSSTNK